MGIKFNDRFENHMDGIDPGTRGDAKKIDDTEDDAYDDDFNEKLSDVFQLSNGASTDISEDDKKEDSKESKSEAESPSKNNGIIDAKGDVLDRDDHLPSGEKAKNKVWGEEEQALWDSDFGAVSEKALDYNDPEYLEEGILKPKWGKDASDEPREVTIPEGTRIVQYAHPGQTGCYFAPEGTEYEDLQLPDSEDKRIKTVYEVQKDGFTAMLSEIATQPWNEDGQAKGDKGVQQYQTFETAEELVRIGKLKRLESENE